MTNLFEDNSFKMKSFRNKEDKDITISVKRLSNGEVVMVTFGPDSISTNRITNIEAEILKELLSD